MKPRPHARQAKLINDALKRKGMKRYALGLAIGLPPPGTYIYDVTSGKSPLTKPETINKIAEVLDIPADDIYFAGDRVPPDVLQAITEHPREMTKLIRLAAQRLED